MTTGPTWRGVKLADVAFVQTGLSKSEAREGEFVKRPYLRVANVQDGYLDLARIKEIDVPVNQLERYLLKKNDIVVAEGGDLDKVGRGYIWAGEIQNCIHQNHVFAVRITKPNQITPEFLALQIQAPPSKKYFLACAKQTTNLASINSSQLKQLPLLIPELSQQKSIVNAIRTWEVAIEKAERLIAAKESRYDHQLSIVFSKVALGRVRIASVASEVNTRNEGGNDARVLSVTNSRGFVLPEDQFERRVASADLSNYKVVLRGQFAYNPSRINVGSIARLDGWDSGVLSPMYVVFAVDSAKVDSDYFLHWLQSHEARERIKNSAQGSVRESVSFTEFSAISIPLPTKQKQVEIAQLLTAMRQEINVLKEYTEKLRLQKRGLMQKLLTGEWRVPVTKSDADTDSTEKPKRKAAK